MPPIDAADHPPSLSRVQRRQEQTRARLTVAASRLIAEHGVEGLRLRSITDGADIGFGSFYSYFSSKDELVEAVAENAIATLAAAVIACIRGLEDPAEAASVAHRWFVRQTVQDRELAWLIVHLDRASVLVERIVMPFTKELLAAGVRTGRFRGLDADVTLTHVVSVTIGMMRAVLEERAPADADVASAEILLTMLGLDGPEAARIARRPMPAAA